MVLLVLITSNGLQVGFLKDVHVIGSSRAYLFLRKSHLLLVQQSSHKFPAEKRLAFCLMFSIKLERFSFIGKVVFMKNFLIPSNDFGITFNLES